MLDFSVFTARVTQLSAAIGALAEAASPLGIPRPNGQEWFDLLHGKLLPQLGGPPLLIVAIVGGTNIGKSVVFNHLAGETASTATPLAAGTKHPVCLAPPGSGDPAVLARIFEHFELCPWHSPDDPLGDAAADRIFWRVGANVPPRLVLVDAPDVDSDVTVNWQRARSIRQSADVLIALLTQQKYNDAAVKQFFRAAVEADKPIIVIFNLCDLQADRAYWPQWLERFRAETGANPELVYVVPHDRRAAEELRLPFYRLDALMNADEAGSATEHSPLDLRNELAAMHFDAIKIRTFRGALARVLDPAAGVPAYLAQIRAAAAQFATAASALSATEMARVAWPNLPTSVLVAEIDAWWDAGRSTWSRRVHGFYRVVGRGVLRPVRAAWSAIAGPPDDPLAAFVRQEQAAVVAAVEKLLDELDRLAQVGNAILQPRLQRILSGQARGELLARVEAAHRELPPVDEDYRAMLRTELDTMKAGHPRVAGWLHAIDQVMAVARPAVTVTLVVSGGVLAGGLVGQVAVHTAGHVVGQVAADTAIATGITEAVVSTTGEGIRQASARLFLRLQTRFAQKRAQWLADFLEKALLGNLLAELRQGAAVTEASEFRNVAQAIVELNGEQIDSTEK